MLIIGGCMLPNYEGRAIKLMYLHFLQDINKVRSYSLADVLSYLSHALCAVSASRKQEITCSLYILQVYLLKFIICIYILVHLCIEVFCRFVYDL